MGTLEQSVWIEATPEQVWRVYVDPLRIPDWQTGKPVIGEVVGAPGEAGSSYQSKRGPLVARTTVLSANAPHELRTTADAYFGLQFEVTSRLSARAGGTDLALLVETHWRRRLGPLAKLVELAVLSAREGEKELGYLKGFVERGQGLRS